MGQQTDTISFPGTIPSTTGVSAAERIITGFSDLAWGTPLLILLLGGGLFFLVYSRLLPFRHFRHAIAILLGRYDNPDEPGQINHYQALSTALAATVGMGNISGVALAITMGGPGAIFWMWISALLGVTTKYFTCTLAVMFRGHDSEGELQGGPMYVIVEGLGRNWKPLALFFSLLGMIGVLPMFQVNQLTQVIRDVVLIPNHVEAGFTSDLVSGLARLKDVVRIDPLSRQRRRRFLFELGQAFLQLGNEVGRQFLLHRRLAQLDQVRQPHPERRQHRQHREHVEEDHGSAHAAPRVSRSTAPVMKMFTIESGSRIFQPSAITWS